ncbi:MAG: hypothetical protein SGILL_003547, partial [Bacillariaceae sp.]
LAIADNPTPSDEIADSSLAEDSQIDSAAAEGDAAAAGDPSNVDEAPTEATVKGNFISNMIQRARSQTMDDQSKDLEESTGIVRTDSIAHSDVVPEEAAKGSNIITSLFRRGGNHTSDIDDIPVETVVAINTSADQEGKVEEDEELAPPPTPEETPKSPTMDFDFTPLSPMYTTRKEETFVDDGNNQGREDESSASLTLQHPSVKIPMALQTPPFHRAQPQQNQVVTDIAAAASSSPSLPSPAPPSPVVATEEESPRAWAGLDEEYEQISASEPPGMTPRVGLAVEENHSLHSREIAKSTENDSDKENDEENHSEEDNGHDPPGYLPSWKDDIKELEESRTEEVDQMKEELDVIFNSMDESADELKHTNPWMTTPVVKKMKNGSAKQPSPTGSDFQNMISSATLGPTPDSTPVSTPVMTQQKTGESVTSGTVTPLRDQSPSRMSDCLNTSAFSDVDPFKETPVRSNLTYAQLDAQGDAAFVSGTPLSKLTSGISSSAPSVASSDNDLNAPAVAIQSNTPRTRKILEWLDPSKRRKQNASDTWPAPSMATKVRSTNTPERQLPSRQLIQNDDTQHAQVRRVSDWWVPRPSYSNSSSPRSLPSMLGNSSQNEVSDLESPNMTYPILNFKFSEEESTINSQSVQDQASEMHSNGGVSPSLRSMLHNTYSLHGAGTGLEPPTPHSQFSSYTAGCPTDENVSPTAGPKSAPITDDVESNTRAIQQNPTADTVDSEGVSKINRTTPQSSRHCRRFTILLLLLAIAAAIAVPLYFKYMPPNASSEDSSSGNENLPTITNAPSAAISSTAAPINAPTTAGFDFSPSIIPPDEDVGDATQPPTSFNAAVTAPPSVASDVAEDFDNLSWDRIENGEGIWRSSGGESDTPIWYFSNPQDQDFAGLNGLSTVPYQALCQPENGKVKVCSGEYGNTDWYGSTALFLRGNSIIAAIIRMNNSKDASPE